MMKTVVDHYESETKVRLHQFAASLGMFALIDVGVTVGIVYYEFFPRG